MALFGRAFGHEPMSWGSMRRELSRCPPDGWLELENWRILKEHLGIRIRIEHGDAKCGASGLPTDDDFQPFGFALTLHYFCYPVQSVPMVQVQDDLVIPVPHPAEGGLAIDGLGYDLARLFSLSENDVKRFLEKAGIEVVEGPGPGNGPRGVRRQWVRAWRSVLSSLTRVRRRLAG